MKRLLMLAMLLLAVSPQLRAQALDIGGIEIRIGQPIATALSRLQVAYDIKYQEGQKEWSVFKKRSRATDLYILVGSVEVEGETVSLINKFYELADAYELTNLYTQAMREIHKRAGSACTTSPVEYADNLLRTIKTVCGEYSLWLGLPERLRTSTIASDNEGSVGGGVQISVGRRP